MICTYAEPVRTWGLEPCESPVFSTNALVSGHGDRGAPRPSGIGRGIFEVQTSLNCFLRFNGRRHSVGGIEGDYYEYQRRSSPATAPPTTSDTTMAVQALGRARTVGNISCTFVVFRPRVSGDLENSRGAIHA